MADEKIVEKDGKLVAVPVEADTTDEISWLESDNEEDAKGYSSIIELHGKKFWILALSRKQNAKADERLKVIQSKAQELDAAIKTKDEAKVSELSTEIPDLSRANEEAVLLKSLKFWDITGKREAVQPEQITKLYRSHQSELYDRIMQKSRMGRSEGSF